MGGLIERNAELSAAQDMLDAAVAGAGRSVLFAGPAGIGKSALVAHAQKLARAAGFRVLSSCPTPVSTGLSHGVVRDWLGPLVRSTSPGTPPFDGPAANLAEALEAPTSAHRVWNLAGLDYALTWVVESLAEHQPLLVVVDDVQWVDVGSLQLLDLLSARLHLMPVALVLALRSGEPSLAADIVDRLAARATTLEPAPLSVLGVEAARRQMEETDGLRGVSAQELHRLTGGVPYLLAELIRSGTPDSPPRSVVDSVRERLSRLAPEAVAVARATAVLGDEAALDALADLTGLSVAGLADPLEVLTHAGILTLGMWRARPAHPLVAEAILSTLTPSERSELHRSAAVYLGKKGCSQQVVASHLVHTLPDEDRAVVELLRAVGEESLRAGASDVAARQLLRAVGETRPEDTDPGLLALAASAHLHAGHRDEAFDLWDRALDRADNPADHARLLADVGDVQMTLGERPEASATYHRAVTALTEAGHDSSSPQMREILVRMGLTRALYDGARAEIVNAVTEATRQPVAEDGPCDRLLFALAASDLAVRARDRDRAVDLALRALGDGALLEEETSEGIGFYVASAVLSWADAYEENLTALGAAVEDAHRRGSVLGFATASYCRGLVHYRQGRLREAAVEFQSALERREEGWTDFAEPAVAGAALTRLGLGRHEEARALEPALRAAAERGQFVSAQPLAVAGLIRAVHGDHEQALDDYRKAARLMGAHPDNASIVEWRELSAWSLTALRRRDEATEIAEEAVVHARQWGAPRALGFALRTLAHVTPRDRSVELLREALAHFEHAACTDYRARAQVDLGRLLLGGGAEQREEGVAMLRSALEHGRTQGIDPVALRAARLLVRAGESVTAGPAGTPVSSLTAGERRVVALAAGGETNRQIAQRLFVTVKAVEWHLSNAYRKLGISSRAELGRALYGESGPNNSSEM
jgi:DNA-binding CsgD family transcriptional regulator/predicted negative regulator of RcsB-dependent stress response